MNASRFVFAFSLSVGLLLCSAQLCVAQDQTIFVSGVSLKIGMAQGVVIEELMKDAKVQKAENQSLYTIIERKGEQRVLGRVLFENGHLVNVDKDWYNGYDAKGHETAELLTSILAQMGQRGLTLATVSTKEVREPNFTLSYTGLRFAGNRKIMLVVSQKLGEEKNKTLQITESLSAN